MSFSKLDELCHSLESLEHGQAILSADEATHMAVGGGEKRAEAIAHLAGLYHAKASDRRIADWIEAAKGEHLNDEQVAALREFERQYHQN